MTGQSIHDEQHRRFDDYGNKKVIGLPAIKDYYKRMRTLDKRAQLNHTKDHYEIAYME